MLLYLLPPSEGKNPGGENAEGKSLFNFSLPLSLAATASEKDLKCSGKRYEEGMKFNKNISNAPKLAAIKRYSGVMFGGIAYDSMSKEAQNYFNEHVLIFSGMYGCVKPQDSIANYKLPITAKGLYLYRKNQHLTQSLIDYALHNQATVIDLLPGAHKKMIDRTAVDTAGIVYAQVNFFRQENGSLEKLRHGVKKIKGQRLAQQCEQQSSSVDDLGPLSTSNKIQIIT